MVASATIRNPLARPYTPHGAAREMFYSRDEEILLDGPAGTGKSRAILEKFHLCCMKYPGIRALILRKTRESMTESVLVTFEERVLPEGSPLMAGASRANRGSYDYHNGSALVVAGLTSSGKDLRAKVMSTEYDMIAVFEATEITEDDLEKLATRLRNAKMPYQQLICDCNPDAPGHWINLRANSPKMRRLLSRHEDNPVLWDREKQDWTQFGKGYIAKLDRLSGARKQRLRHGKWVSAEGAVYQDSWDAARNVVDSAPPEMKGYFAAVDWGYRDPGVMLVFGVDGDKRMYCVAQVFRTAQLIGWWVDQAKRLNEKYNLQVIACDPSEPGHIAEFNNAGLHAIEANNDILLGIRRVEERLRPSGDDRARLFFVRGNLIERDESLVESKHPWCAEQEFDSYSYTKTQDGKANKEEPADFNNHGMDALRYAVNYAEDAWYGDENLEIVDLPENMV